MSRITGVWRKQMDAHRTKLALLELALMVPLLFARGLCPAAVQKKQGRSFSRFSLPLSARRWCRLFFTLHEYLPRIWF
jgi:hypothetical protein